MRCEELMKKDVVCVGPKDTVQAAAEKMRFSNVGFLPVCDEARKAMGTITDRDIAIRLCAYDKSASQTKVEEIMTHELIYCQPGDNISKAEELMAKHHKSRVLVIDEKNDTLVGVISLSDIAEHERGGRVVKTLREVVQRELH